jgi:hypothetical protein
MHLPRRSFAFCFLAGLSLLGTGCDTSGPASFPVRTYPLGDKVALGHYVYVFYDTEWLTQLGQGPSARIPQNRFFLVRLSVLNNGAEETMVPNMTVEDDNGHTYTEVSNGEGVPQWIGFVRPIKPASSMQGQVVFDVPPAHYRIRFEDDERSRAALVDIPLTFSHEAPPELPPALPQQ